MGFEGTVQFVDLTLAVLFLDLLLSGDNAVSSAMACRNLPARQRRQAMLAGTGLAILRELTRFDPALKVVMVSGDVRPESISQALAGGAVAYLGKPFSVEEVTDAVDHAMSLSARRPS